MFAGCFILNKTLEWCDLKARWAEVIEESFHGGEPVLKINERGTSSLVLTGVTTADRSSPDF